MKMRLLRCFLPIAVVNVPGAVAATTAATAPERACTDFQSSFGLMGLSVVEIFETGGGLI
jgi:hypothetical protein